MWRGFFIALMLKERARNATCFLKMTHKTRDNLVPCVSELRVGTKCGNLRIASAEQKALH
ncbi:hypothetical protein ED28_11865 [[Pantoea] beijingensis]|uniref:Uncharacterized protein n=1 Tax=[Pantoea] beijingensis TaxID=1324864 RepID=A0A443ICN7_9GAMM|nr:hypothetical protein ED28_11865 [[Pantoea] beijingensis]